MDPAQISSLFRDLGDTIHMNTAALALGCKPAVEAYKSAVDAWSAGTFDYLEAERAGEDARAAFARLINAPTETIALIPAVSATAGLIAAQLPQARPGENVLVGAGEFTSNLFSWRLLE